MRTKELKSWRERAPKQCEITAKDFPDPAYEAMKVFPSEHYLLGGKNIFLEINTKSRENIQQ